MTHKTHILVVIVAGIGDLILASKSIRAMRKGYPNAVIHLLTSSEASPLAKNYDFIDHVIAFPIRELRKSRFVLLDIPRLILRLRRLEFRILINLYQVNTWAGSIKMGMLFSLLKAQERIGHNNKGFGLFLSKKAPANVFRIQHFTDAMLDIARLAGGISDNGGIEVFWDKSCEMKMTEMLNSKTEVKKLKIGINPGADVPDRRWNPAFYAIVADDLCKRFDTQIFLLGGPGEEALAARIQSDMKNKVVNLAGRLTLNELVYAIHSLDLLLTNDSGPVHIAAAVKTPIVALYRPEDILYTRPYTSKELCKILYSEIERNPFDKKKLNQPSSLDFITPEEVIEKCVELISGFGA
jgi:heptosyltransferase-1